MYYHINDIFNNGNVQKDFQNLCCCYICVYCLMTSIMRIKIFLALQSYTLYFLDIDSLDAIKCKMHPNLKNFEIWKKLILESGKYGNNAVDQC
jgi:hypothetical protein